MRNYCKEKAKAAVCTAGDLSELRLQLAQAEAELESQVRTGSCHTSSPVATGWEHGTRFQQARDARGAVIL